jgi:hypothetical protein
MAVLTDADRLKIGNVIMRELSNLRISIPILKPALRDAIVVFDERMNVAEVDILNSVTPSVRSWLISHQAIARRIIIEVEKVRKESL